MNTKKPHASQHKHQTPCKITTPNFIKIGHKHDNLNWMKNLTILTVSEIQLKIFFFFRNSFSMIEL